MLETAPFKHDNADDSPGFLLWKLTGLWQGKLSHIFGKFGITQTQYAILASLLWFEQGQESPSQARLVEHSKIDKMTLSKAVRKLQKMDLVCRTASTTDIRAIEVRLTGNGRNLIPRAIVAVEHEDDEFFSGLSDEQLKCWKVLTTSIMNGNNTVTQSAVAVPAHQR